MNTVILVGNLARDPELKATQNGYAFCNFTVACQRRVRNAQGASEADFIPCVAWRERGEFVHRYFKKGQKIVVQGSLQIRSYEAQDGTKRYKSEVVVDNVEFAERKHDAGQGAPRYESSPPGPEPPAEASQEEFVDVDDSELPFE